MPCRSLPWPVSGDGIGKRRLHRRIQPTQLIPYGCPRSEGTVATRLSSSARSRRQTWMDVTP